MGISLAPPRVTILPAQPLDTLLSFVPLVPSVCFTVNAGVWYGHKGGPLNTWVALTGSGTIIGVPSSVVLSQASLSMGSSQVVQLTASTFSSSGTLLTGRTYTWASSNTAAATVNGTGLVTGVAAGVTNISANDTGIVGLCVVTVVTSGGGGGGAGPNLPGGTNVQLNTGLLTIAPPNTHNGTVTVNGYGFINISPDIKSQFGEWAQNLSLDPSGTGWRFTYDPTLSFGGSPVRSGFQNFTQLGTGLLYSYRTLFMSPNWLQNTATGTKMAEPHTTSFGSIAGAAENHVLQMTYDVTNNNTILQPCLFLQGPFNQSVDYFCPNGSVGIITGGATHTVEEILQQESVAGQNTGTYQCWVDGAQVITVTGLHYCAAGQGLGWTSFFIDPTYGGAGGSPPTTMWWTLVSWYVALK